MSSKAQRFVRQALGKWSYPLAARCDFSTFRNRKVTCYWKIVDQGPHLDPKLTLEPSRNTKLQRSSQPLHHAAGRERLYESMRLAGVPEG